ncbi:unnamed protein product [Diatraea saccharalis]|uniref:Globin domain-containing protein n=1 Tax=Diatraea saccharalis TaxID=40085 RepID=A0A9N9W9E7_9NEOP|nr:unnamed protein product [Diatraea saccharalis]
MDAILNKIRWGGDPDTPEPHTGLSKRDVYNIKRTWEIIYAQGETYGLEVFLRLFRMNPVTKTYFKMVKDMDETEIKKSNRFKAHVITFMSSLNMAVANLHQPSVVEALMNKLGESHRKAHVDIVHFEEARTVLIDMLKKDLAQSDDVISSWGRFIAFIYKHIFVKLTKPIF